MADTVADADAVVEALAWALLAAYCCRALSRSDRKTRPLDGADAAPADPLAEAALALDAVLDDAAALALEAELVVEPELAAELELEEAADAAASPPPS